MEENKVITLGDMIKQIINENQLSEVDETEIQKMRFRLPHMRWRAF